MRSFEEVAGFIRQHEVGRRAYIETPYGRRLICYADLTATGRFLHFIEAWIRRVRPFYANTHTAVSSTGRIVTTLREKAREVVHRSVNASEDDVVLFCGSGATASVNKLVGLLGLRVDEPYRDRLGLQPHERPIVFVGPYEHHSNVLPWVESVADVVEVDLDADGGIDLAELEQRLIEFRDRPLKIGSFSAASNVTGVLSDVPAIAEVLHAQGAFVCFDYAAAGPYVPIDMHPSDPAHRIDAVYLSMHKFIGGPEASGVLVVNRALFRTGVPERPGGGTVEYVEATDRDSIDYSRRLDEREEGGTPAILGDVRAGTAFLVKEMIGAEAIESHEMALAVAAVKRLAGHSKIQVLGPLSAQRLGIISFNVEGLHFDLVSALLDHLFGIQNRAGCSCAGPYGHKLLGIDRGTAARYRALTRRGIGGVKPGWVRLTIPFYANEADFEFLMSAIEFVAEHGRDLVPLYRFSWRDGVWRHIERPAPNIEPIELTVDALEEAAGSFAAGDHEAPISEREVLAERERYFDEAERVVERARERWRHNPPTWNPTSGDPEIDELIAFEFVHTDSIPQTDQAAQ